MIEAAAIAAHHQGLGFPVVTVIVVDDAPQFRLSTKELPHVGFMIGGITKS